MFCNGWLLVNNEKMSKSKGNFFTVQEFIQKFSADSFRMACANAGDTLEDANLEEDVANKRLIHFPVFLELIKGFVGGSEKMKEGGSDDRFVDRWFANEMNRLVVEAKEQYEKMAFREALRAGYFEFMQAFDSYRDVCKTCSALPSKALVMRYIEWQMIVLSPIAPHFCEHVWGILGKPGTILDARFPEPTQAVENSIVSQGTYIFDKVPHDFIRLLEKSSKAGRPTAGTIYVASCFPDWKVKVLDILRKRHAANQLPLEQSTDAEKAQWKEVMQELMSDSALKPFAKALGPFASFKRDEVLSMGAAALDAKSPFDEMSLLKELMPYLQDKLKLDVEVAVADSPLDPAHKEAANNSQPGKPTIFYAGVGAAGKPKAGGGDKSGGGGDSAAKGGKAAAKADPSKVMTDVKALDAHLATRSYVKGGPGPTAADAAQFDAINVSAEKVPNDLPHLGRWCRHMAFFTPAARSRW